MVFSFYTIMHYDGRRASSALILFGTFSNCGPIIGPNGIGPSWSSWSWRVLMVLEGPHGPGGSSWSLAVPHGPGGGLMVLEGPHGPSWSWRGLMVLAVLHGPSRSLMVPRGPSWSLAVPHGPGGASWSLAVLEGSWQSSMVPRGPSWSTTNRRPHRTFGSVGPLLPSNLWSNAHCWSVVHQ